VPATHTKIVCSLGTVTMLHRSDHTACAETAHVTAVPPPLHAPASPRVQVPLHSNLHPRAGLSSCSRELTDSVPLCAPCSVAIRRLLSWLFAPNIWPDTSHVNMPLHAPAKAAASAEGASAGAGVAAEASDGAAVGTVGAGGRVEAGAGFRAGSGTGAGSAGNARVGLGFGAATGAGAGA
jgi:hypothetical protein